MRIKPLLLLSFLFWQYYNYANYAGVEIADFYFQPIVMEQ